MFKRLLAVGALGSLAGCVVGPGYGYADQGYAAAPVYGAAPAYGYAPGYGYGQVDIAVGSQRDGRDYHGYHDGPPRGDWHGSRDDARAAQQRGYGGPRPQPGQTTAANGGRDPNGRGGYPGANQGTNPGANPGAGGGPGQQGRQGGGGHQEGGGSNGRSNWQGNGNGNANGNARW